MKADLGNNRDSRKQDHILEIDQHKSPGRLSHQKKLILKETFHWDPEISSQWGWGVLLRPGAVGRGGMPPERICLGWGSL